MSEDLRALNQVGVYLAKQGKFEAAAAAFRRALIIQDEPGVRANFANVLRRLWKFDEATKAMEGATENDFSHFVRASLDLETGNAAGAVAHMDKIENPSPHLRFCKAMACLQAGYWQKGFELYEARLELMPQPPINLPQWEGQNWGSVLVPHEQGYGDSLMFSRYLRQIDHVLSVPSPLLRLFQASGFDAVNGAAATPNAEFTAPMMSLPHRMGVTDVQPAEPYISIPEQYPLPKPAGTKLSVGIVWTAKAQSSAKGMEEALHGQQKSIPLELLLPICAIPGIAAFSLQTGDAGMDVFRVGAEHQIVHLGSAIMDFYDLAAFMGSLDLIVSVDTAPLHLAGAMGKPAIGLLSYPRSWQWPPNQPNPWYRDIDLIQQTKPGDWQSVVDQLCAKLGAM